MQHLIFGSDDTSVAILEKEHSLQATSEHAQNPATGTTKSIQHGLHELQKEQRNHNEGIEGGDYSLAKRRAMLHFHERITADNSKFQGVHPMIALDSHQVNLGQLVQKALENLPASKRDRVTLDHAKNISVYDPVKNSTIRKCKPDFVSVTRGPGMRSSLSTGVDTAKGLAVAWQVPLVGVNHMQAHALTPRLVSALETLGSTIEPAFPFLSLLVSGGHTMLVNSGSLTSHKILATTADIAIGDCLDKCARHILPSELLTTEKDTMYGRLLEAIAFRSGTSYEYSPPSTRGEELARKSTRWGWAFGAPLAATRSGIKSKSMEFSFTGTGSAVTKIVKARTEAGGMSEDERREIAKEAMRVVFEHLASRTVMALHNMQFQSGKTVDTLVVSGGVASNGFLKHILRSFLDIRGFSHVKLSLPPPELCTDNAAMIAWTGMEMYEAGWESDLGIQAVRKWSIDPGAEDGGILGLGGWKRRSGQ